ncbi:MAG: hypothetical protein HUU56_07930 [Bdellovibrionaceae bacterium]|nr:hypothetical protein [Pseudobdellovibrionaceae bacterium]
MKKIVLIALSAISIFLTFWIYRNYFKPQNVLRPTELSDKNIYEKIARSAGGEVVHIDTGSSPEKMNDFIQMNYEENNYVLLWAAEGETISHEILTEFQIDQNIKKISILVSGLNKKPEVEVFNPRKQKVTFTKVLESKQSIKQIFDHPEQGKWKLKISSSENIQVKILALSDLLVSPPEPVELRGRPGHEGYFQYRGTFVSGSKVKFNSDLSTIKLSSNKDMNIKSSEISLLSLGGKTLESGTVNSDFRIPAEPFRTLITWTDGEGRSGQRMSQRIFEPNKLPLVSFSMNSDQPTSQEFCDLINSSASWNLFAGS